jgi:anti-sigma B factor antagonist
MAGRATTPTALTTATTRGRRESAVSVTGRVVIETSPRLRAALLEAIRTHSNPVLTVDVSGVSYLDTSGVATLLEASRLARAHGVRLRVLGLAGEPEMLARVLEMEHIFPALGSDVEFR